MRTHFAYSPYQVFLNYPFDENAEPISTAMHFAVAAAGLLPVCALDLTTPDRPRLEMIVEAIINCHYSAHDFSRFQGEGESNMARFNMPVEMGMALFHGLHTQRVDHRCSFFVSSPYAYRRFVSDLAGLDPIVYEDELELITGLYGWLRDSVQAVFIPRPTAEIIDGYKEFQLRARRLRGSGKNGKATHHEKQELIFQVCSEHGWWDWRASQAGKRAFPEVPLSWVVEPTQQ